MATQRPLKTKVSITLDHDVIDTIHELADQDDRNFSQFINMALKRYIAYDRKAKQTKEPEAVIE
jgi:metal-responsive CopG/Arc/MetJ family transcriptional regulator